jgi:H+/gluconate symporter-like permease
MTMGRAQTVRDRRETWGEAQMIPKLKQVAIVVVLGFVLLAVMNKPGPTSTLVQSIATMVGDVLHNVWLFITTLFSAATKK